MKTFREYIFEGIYEDKINKLKAMRLNIEKIENPQEKERAIARADEFERNITVK